MNNKIFISYRRESGADLARLIKDSLNSRDFNVFIDVDDLRSGHFDKALYREIEESSDVIVVLNPGCLDNCHDEDDWMKLEIVHAIKTGKNIVPFMTADFSWPSDSLPDDLAELPLFHGVSASHQYFPASIDHLMFLLKTVPSNKSILKHFRSTLFGLAIVVTLSFLSWFFWQNHASTYDANVLSDVPLGNGKLLFSTESFKPPDKQMSEEKNLSIGDERVMFIQDISKDDVTEIELAFQIINSSQKLITI